MKRKEEASIYSSTSLPSSTDTEEWTNTSNSNPSENTIDLRIASQNTIDISSNIDVSYATEYNENFKDGEMVDLLTILAFGFHHHKCQVLLDC